MDDNEKIEYIIEKHFNGFNDVYSVYSIVYKNDRKYRNFVAEATTENEANNLINLIK